MEHDEGFVLANKVRLAIFEEVLSGETDATHIAKKHHLVRPAAEQAVKDLVERGLLEQDGDTLTLTEAGEAAADQVRKLSGQQG